MKGFDPIASAIGTDIRRAQQQLGTLTMRTPSKWERFCFRVVLWRQNRSLDVFLWSVPAVLLLASVTIFALSVPWTSNGSGQDAVVVACASVVFLGGILSEAIALPVARAAELGPGLTQSLIRRASFWLGGVMAIPIAVFLFWLASRNPDAEAAMGAALLAGAAYGLYWLMTRHALAAADPMEVARSERKRLLRNVRRFMRHGEALANAYIDTALPEEVQSALRTAQKRQFGGAPVRQLRSSARRLFAGGATDEGLMFADAMLEGFFLLATETDGAVGDYNDLPGEVLESLEGFVAVSMSHHDDFVAQILVGRVSQLAVFPYTHADAGALRLHANGRLRGLLETHWDDMTSRVPAAAAGHLARMPNSLIALGAHEDVQRALQGLETVIIRAVVDGRSNISVPAVSGFVENLSRIMMIADPDLRRTHLRRWRVSAERLFMLATLPDSKWPRAQDHLIPGVGLAGASHLQQALVNGLHGASAEVVVDVCGAIYAALDDAIPAIARADQAAALRPLANAFDLLLCLGHVVIASSDRISPEARQALARRHINVAMRAVGALDDESLADQLRYEDVLAMVWSNLVTPGAICREPEIVKLAAQQLLERLLAGAPFGRLGTYERAFFVGVAVLAGRSAIEADRLIEEDPDPFAGFDGGRYPLLSQRGPGCARASTFVGDPASEVDRWLLENFPDLLAGPVV